MADSDQILQLGIDEARNGNREAARNLFELLTRQEPNNAQAWLWLAGVADGADQRRAALQRVIDLEPENEMARKGLQAMGVVVADAPTAAMAPVPAVVTSEPAPASEPARPRNNDEAFADELDMAFSDDYASIPRAEAPRREPDEEAAVGSTTSSRSSALGDRPTLRRPSPRVRTVTPDDDDDAPMRRGPNPLLWVLLALVGVAIVAFLLLNMFRGPDNGTATLPTSAPTSQETPAASQPTADPNAAQPTVDPNAPKPTADPNVAQPTVDPNAPQPTADPNAAQPTADPNAAQPTADPNAAQPTAAPPTTPPETANPAPAALGTTLQANGWNYTFPQANYAVALGKQAGGQTAQGTFVHVLAWVANTTGKDQPITPEFFVLKDAQGRVYTAQAKLSSALVNRGVNADVGLEDTIPANGTTTSVYLVFDVQPDATDLILFARANPSQGFKVLDRAQ